MAFIFAVCRSQSLTLLSVTSDCCCSGSKRPKYVGRQENETEEGRENWSLQDEKDRKDGKDSHEVTEREDDVDD